MLSQTNPKTTIRKQYRGVFEEEKKKKRSSMLEAVKKNGKYLQWASDLSHWASPEFKVRNIRLFKYVI